MDHNSINSKSKYTIVYENKYEKTVICPKTWNYVMLVLCAVNLLVFVPIFLGQIFNDEE